MIDTRFWRDRRVFLSGHTGFKGGWMALLLHHLGAKVFGFALPPESRPNLFTAADIERTLHHRVGDLRDVSAVRAAVDEAEPEIVFHMGAQALVRQSYLDPVSTYATNVMGTVHVLDAVRHVSSVQAVVVVTSDKCYENREWPWGYRENDRVGGRDPYSNSKGCAELVTDAYRRSFFETGSAARIATARAGNVIGGGDWSTDRLVPDAVRAFVAGQPLGIRNPSSIRPWQHVFDPLAGYLLLGQRLIEGGRELEGGWNFGPSAASEVSVGTLADFLVRNWGDNSRWERAGGDQLHEATFLKLDCSKARLQLGWRPLVELERAVELTVEWHRAFESGRQARQLTLDQIARFLDEAN